MAEAQRISWDETLRKTALEFLNTMAFLQDRREWEKEQMERWKRSH